jgi:hypothetical protein
MAGARHDMCELAFNLPWWHSGGSEVQLYCFFNLGASWGFTGLPHAPAALPPLNRHVIHCTAGRVGPRAGLDWCGKYRLPPEFDPRPVLPVASRYTD